MSDFENRMAKRVAKQTGKTEAEARKTVASASATSKTNKANTKAQTEERIQKKDRPQKYKKANRARGEFKYWFDDKEALFVPSFASLVEVEENVGPLLEVIAQFSTGNYKIHHAIEVLVALNQGDFITREEFYRHISKLIVTGNIAEFGMMVGDCLGSLIDPEGLGLKEVSVEEAEEDPN